MASTISNPKSLGMAAISNFGLQNTFVNTFHFASEQQHHNGRIFLTIRCKLGPHAKTML
jgi:hypothetical protein